MSLVASPNPSDGNYGYEDIDFGQRLYENGTRLIFENRATAYHQESDFISPYQRHKGLSMNRIKLYERYPGLARFRRVTLGTT
ncbi:MAG: glycosyltransferase family 2 protein [Nitrososphaeraceae archaeon]